MRAAQRRVFRIEQNRTNGGKSAHRANGANGTGGTNGANGAVATNGAAIANDPAYLSDPGTDHKHGEIMAALADIRACVREPDELPTKIIEDYKNDLLEARKIKDELNRIYEAIGETKREIATLRDSGRDDLSVARMTDELGAIVEGTENATETILHAAEEIDTKATDLVAALRQQANKNDACDIQEQVIKIFEACNFQDLTGQRITKVVNTFRFIEERVERMMEIWGGIESFQGVQPVELPERTDHEELLNGPALEEDEDVASQDDIDALFD